MSGLTIDGFDKKTLDEALADLNAAIQAAFAAANTSPESVFGQINGIISEIIGDLWDLAELTYQSQYPATAIGVALDNIAELNSLTRLEATSSIVEAIVEGSEGTVVPLSTQFSQTGTDEVFESLLATTITKTNLLQTAISVNTIAGAPHTIDITFESTTDNYSSAFTSSELDILNDLAGQINLSSTHDAVVDTTLLTITITPSDLTTPFEVSIGASLTLDEIWSPISLSAINTGAIEAPINSIINIITPVFGMDQVDNLVAGTIGRETETDDEFRLRRKQSVGAVGAATVPAIEARLVDDIINVTAAIVKDNRTDVTDSFGRPPHSFESIVTYPSGDTVTEQEIADLLWAIKPAGIESFGNITKQITDSTGQLQNVSFSRPTDKYVHLDIEITKSTEDPPVLSDADLIDAIKEALVDFGDELSAGEDVLYQKFYQAIYSVQGVDTIEKYEQAITENPGDTPAALVSGSITGLPDTLKIQDTGAAFITNNVVSGMAIENTTSSVITGISRVISETNLSIREAIFLVAQNYSVGGFYAYNIPIADNEISNFDTTRITITMV